MPFSFLVEQLTLPLQFPEEEQLNTFFGEQNQPLIRSVYESLLMESSQIFYIYGKSGFGKTHFLKGVCIEGLKSGKICAYLPLKERENISISNLSELENYDVLVIDDLQEIVDDISWQTAIFHLFNRIWSFDKTKLFISATRAPADLNFILPDLISRLYGGHLYALPQLLPEEILGALQHRAQIKGLKLSSQAGLFFVRQFYPNQKILFEQWKDLDEISFKLNHRITIPFIKKTLTK